MFLSMKFDAREKLAFQMWRVVEGDAWSKSGELLLVGYLLGLLWCS